MYEHVSAHVGHGWPRPLPLAPRGCVLLHAAARVYGRRRGARASGAAPRVTAPPPFTPLHTLYNHGERCARISRRPAARALSPSTSEVRANLGPGHRERARTPRGRPWRRVSPRAHRIARCNPGPGARGKKGKSRPLRRLRATSGRGPHDKYCVGPSPAEFDPRARAHEDEVSQCSQTGAGGPTGERRPTCTKLPLLRDLATADNFDSKGTWSTLPRSIGYP